MIIAVIGNEARTENLENDAVKRNEEKMVNENRKEVGVKKNKVDKILITVETQTDENDFCMCFVPEYHCKNDECTIIDPRITVKLDNVVGTDEEKVIVRNFEASKDWQPKQRWRISGHTVRAVNRLSGRKVRVRKKNPFMDISLTDDEDIFALQPVKSGLYTRGPNREIIPIEFVRKDKRFSISMMVSDFKKNRRERRESKNHLYERSHSVFDFAAFHESPQNDNCDISKNATNQEMNIKYNSSQEKEDIGAKSTFREHKSKSLYDIQNLKNSVDSLDSFCRSSDNSAGSPTITENTKDKVGKAENKVQKRNRTKLIAREYKSKSLHNVKDLKNGMDSLDSFCRSFEISAASPTLLENTRDKSVKKNDVNSNDKKKLINRSDSMPSKTSKCEFKKKEHGQTYPREGTSSTDDIMVKRKNGRNKRGNRSLKAGSYFWDPREVSNHKEDVNFENYKKQNMERQKSEFKHGKRLNQNQTVDKEEIAKIIEHNVEKKSLQREKSIPKIVDAVNKEEVNKDEPNNQKSKPDTPFTAFAIVPGTHLQRKLSQRGINDKAPVNTIEPKKSVVDNKQLKRRSFRSVDDLFTASNKIADSLSALMNTSQSVDELDVDDTNKESTSQSKTSNSQQEIDYPVLRNNAANSDDDDHLATFV